MAQKPVKKAPVKKAVAVKAPAKKPAVKAAPVAQKPAVKAAPVAQKPAVKAAPVKKPVAVKAVVAKKVIAQKATKATAKVMAAPAPETKAVMAAPACACGSECCCKKTCGGFCRFVKKLIVFLVIFALGFAAAKFCCDGKNDFRKGPRMPDIFVNGCLDVAKIQCPEMAQKIAMADVNADTCIDRDEYRAFKKEMRKDFHGDKPCPASRPEMAN